MIVVKLKGGLGNQFFQYAVGRHLAEIHQTSLKIDISFFETYELHAYSIWPFNIKENIASAEEVAALTVPDETIARYLIRRLLRRATAPATTYIRERQFCFDPDILNLPSNVYLDGYWQSEKYFIDIAAIIRDEFTVKAPQTGEDKELGKQIESCESVSLHVRRGNYLQPPYNSFHGICSLAYYSRAVEYLTQRVLNPHFFVFSDDAEWVQDNLRLSYPTTFVDHNDADKDYEDLRLLSQCKHHIIANSTFSWWGAWLCAHTEKVVIAPRQWFNAADHDTSDLIPRPWIQV